MQEKQTMQGIQIFSQEASDRLAILKQLTNGVIDSIKLMESIVNKLEGFKAEIHIKDCYITAGEVSDIIIN